MPFASGKGVSALEIKQAANASRLITFGDHYNDVPMFDVADVSYAVATATDEAKSAATFVLNGETVADAILRLHREQNA